MPTTARRAAASPLKYRRESGLVWIVECESELFELRLIDFQDLVDRFLVVVLVGLVDVCKFTQVVAGGSLFFSRQLLLLLWARFVSAASPRAHDASSVCRVSVVVVRISYEWV